MLFLFQSDFNLMWGISSAGRARRWQRRGQRFDPAILHQKIRDTAHWLYPFFLFQ